MHDILRILYLFLPAGVANLTPPVLTRFFGPGRPIDGGRTWRGKPVFGEHKTWQGLIGGTMTGTVFFIVQHFFDHYRIPLMAGIAMSFGALAGDLVKSFVKRRLGAAPGAPWIPFDQIDYILGAIVLSLPFLRLTWREIIAVVVIYAVAHVIVSMSGYALHFKTDLL